MNKKADILQRIVEAMNLIETAKSKIAPQWQAIATTAKMNQKKVLEAFHTAKISSDCFSDSTGYGYHDLGRDALENVFRLVFKAEAALVRPQIVSGTHAINLCLSLLQPGDELISLSGTPYDTLLQVIGVKGAAKTSLIKRGIRYREVALDAQGHLDWEGIAAAVTKNTRMVMLQRSRGYSWRPSIAIDDIAQAFKIVKDINPDCICFVDNCYGEFVELVEPVEVGADIMAGSLIKNPGGGLAPSGGYIVGRKELVEQCGECLTAPGIGAKLGPTFNLTRPLLQGFFLAPHVVGQALRGAVLAAQVFHDLGYRVSPLPEEPRTDVIQAIELQSREKLLAFCKAVQQAAPVDAHFTPIPELMPGYDDEVVMAAGTFIQGASIELSADAPLRPPYIAYFQGGLTIEHIELALESIVQQL